jgi:hypothetical protein
VLKRTEADSHFLFHHDAAGSAAIVVRSSGELHELQAAISQQNFGLVLMFKSSPGLKMELSNEQPSLSITDNALSTIFQMSFSVSLTAETDVSAEISKVLFESMRSIRIFQEGSEQEYTKFGMEAHLPPTRLAIQNGCLMIDRNYRHILNYRAKIRFPGEISYSGEKVVMNIPRGYHTAAIFIELSGRYHAEDFSALASAPVHLLHETVLAEYGTLSPFRKDMVDRNLDGIFILASRAKLMAGSPRFLTYFGRDTLLSLSLLVGKTKEELLYYGLKSVFSRLSADGEVAHEEVVGEFAHLISDTAVPDIPRPQLEYHMVDDDFLLSLTLVRCIEKGFGTLIEQLLDEEYQGGSSGHMLLAGNIRFCRKQLRMGLVAYHEDESVGDWRDSLASQGIRYSYELNLGLVPFLESAVTTLTERFPRLRKILELDNGENPADTDADADTDAYTDADAYAAHLSRERNRYLVTVSLKQVRQYLDGWLEEAGFSDLERKVLGGRISGSTENSLYTFYALALDRTYEPIKIQHNDIAFSLLYGDPDDEELDIMLKPLETPFPLGLKTEVGLLVSNPCFADDREIRRSLIRKQYHGLVIWPLMHNILFHGIQRQLARVSDKQLPWPLSLIERLENLKAYILDVMEKAGSFSTSELYSFTASAEGDLIVPFGRGSGSTTESNPVQLWSNLTFTTVLGEEKSV